MTSPGKWGRSTSASGRREASPNRSSNSDAPKPTVSVSRCAVTSSASPVSSGGASGEPPTAPSPTGRPAVSSRAATVQSCSSERSPSTSDAVTSNAAKCRCACTDVATPAWWAPWNGTTGSDRPGAAGVAPGAGDGTDRDGGHPGRPDAEGAEETAAADVLAGHRTPQPAAAAASCDSGSPSASTARASSCRCGSATVS